ncbi:MAG: hypothetical protein ACK46X_03050 [Candidatus Sericytochromatia bacterium]
MAQDIRTTAATSTAASKPVIHVAKPVVEAKVPVMAADNLRVRRAEPKPEPAEPKAAKKAPPSPSAAVPGEDVRNTVSLTNTILGPLVTLKQGIGMLASATFKSRMGTSLAQGAVKAAEKASKFLPFLKSPIAAKSLQLVGRGLPFISAGILAFDAFATVKTFMNPEASGTRKALTAGRFLFNAIATGVSFIPGAGFIYSMPPALVGNVFEIAMAKLNTKEAAAAQT